MTGNHKSTPSLHLNLVDEGPAKLKDGQPRPSLLSFLDADLLRCSKPVHDRHLVGRRGMREK